MTQSAALPSRFSFASLMPTSLRLQLRAPATKDVVMRSPAPRLDYISRDALQSNGYFISSIPSGCSTSVWTTYPGRLRGERGARGGRGMGRGGAGRGGAVAAYFGLAAA